VTWHAIHVARVVEASKPDLAAGSDRVLCSALIASGYVPMNFGALPLRTGHTSSSSAGGVGGKCSGVQWTAPTIKMLVRYVAAGACPDISETSEYRLRDDIGARISS